MAGKAALYSANGNNPINAKKIRPVKHSPISSMVELKYEGRLVVSKRRELEELWEFNKNQGVWIADIKDQQQGSIGCTSRHEQTRRRRD